MDQVFQYATSGKARYDFAHPVAQIQAVTQPAAFPQRPGALNALLGEANSEPEQSEAAYHLRVQAPTDAQDLPVVVYVPGGGFLSGTGMARWFAQDDSPDENPVILVTVNYRIGVFGHMGPTCDSRDSQKPLYDILLALQWVKAHIADFGGDPENTTLAGDSAGAWHSYALGTMPEAKGLFQRLVLLSMPREAPLTAGEYQERWSTVNQMLETAGGFEDAPIDAVLDAQQHLAKEYAGRGMAVMPAAGGSIPDDLADYSQSTKLLHVDQLLLLSTENEAQAFLFPVPEAAFTAESVNGYIASHFTNATDVQAWLRTRGQKSSKQQMADLMTLYQFLVAHYELAVAGAASGKQIYVGGFSISSPLTQGSPHCFPVPFVFGRRDVWHDAPMLDGVEAKTFETGATKLRQWISSFVHTGQPQVAEAQQTLTHRPFSADAEVRLDFNVSGSGEVAAEFVRPEAWSVTAQI